MEGQLRDFAGYVALVTGSSRGLGRELALAYGRRGADVVVNYNGSGEQARKVVQEIVNMDVKCQAFKADVSKEAEVQSMVDSAIRDFGKVDILVNNAAIYKDSTIHKMKLEDWEAVLRTDLTGPMLCSKYALQGMRERNYGRILNISSIVGQKPVFGTGSYAASKAALEALTKVTAIENASKRIVVNCLSLGYTETGMRETLSPQIQSEILKTIPIGRWITKDEVTEMALSMTSKDAANYGTGNVKHLNGGLFP